jgi:CBS-domain-containing membrane protein
MTTSVVTVRPDTPYRELAVMFREHRVSGFPVTAGDGTVVGVVSESDLVALAAGQRHRGRRAVTISPDDLVRTAARLMQSHRVQRLPVTDRDGRLEGIVSRSDVLSVFRRSDEKVRREVTQDVIADGFFTDPARFTVTVHNGIVTLEGEPGSAVLGASIADQVEHLEGVIAVRDRFVYPARSAPSFPSDPGL